MAGSFFTAGFGTGSPITLPVSIANGGTGATTANGALNALLALSLGQTGTFALSDNVTNTAPIARVLSHVSSGTTAASFGVGDATDLQNASGTLKRVATDVVALTTATNGAEVATRTIQAMVAGALATMATFGTQTDFLSANFPGAGSATQPTISVGAPANKLGFYPSGATLAAVAGGSLCCLFGSGGITMASSTTIAARTVTIGGGGAMQLNRATGVASATTLTVTANGNQITGTTTINGIVTTGWQAGTRIALELANGITITNASGSPGANAVAILLRTGSNLTTSGAYLLDLYYNGTNWVQPN